MRKLLLEPRQHSSVIYELCQQDKPETALDINNDSDNFLYIHLFLSLDQAEILQYCDSLDIWVDENNYMLI